MLSPVGNRVSVFDLVKLVTTVDVLILIMVIEQTLLHFRNQSYTLPFENRKNIAAIAISPDSNVLITVDEGNFIP